MDVTIDEYYSYCRDDLVRLVPISAKTILEVGCGIGNTGKILKTDEGRLVVGIDITPNVKELAEKVYDRFILCNIETSELDYPDGYFDCIIYGDVLEHLVDPWKLLEKHSRLLKSGGSIVASIPNIRHYKVIKDLLFKGRFEYKDSGITDMTHLRFFTLNSIISLFHGSYYELAEIKRNIRGSKSLLCLNSMLGGILKELLTKQYLVRVIKP